MEWRLTARSSSHWSRRPPSFPRWAVNSLAIHLPVLPGWGREGGRQSLDRAGHGNTGLCFSPQACCVPYHQRTAICFKEIGKVFVKPVTQPIMAEGCMKAWLQPGLGCIFLCHLKNRLQRRQNKSWPPLQPTCVSEGCPVCLQASSKLLLDRAWVLFLPSRPPLPHAFIV